MDILSCPINTAYYPDIGLHVPLYHFLGNRIAFYVRNPKEILTERSLQVSVWRYRDKNKYGESFKGRFHIAPVDFAELTLIEDIVERSDKPKDFPFFMERTTKKNLVNASMFYPASQEIWNFRIHLEHTGIVEDDECELMLEEVLVAREGWTGWERTQRADYEEIMKQRRMSGKKENLRWGATSPEVVSP